MIFLEIFIIQLLVFLMTKLHLLTHRDELVIAFLSVFYLLLDLIYGMVLKENGNEG